MKVTTKCKEKLPHLYNFVLANVNNLQSPNIQYMPLPSAKITLFYYYQNLYVPFFGYHLLFSLPGRVTSHIHPCKNQCLLLEMILGLVQVRP